MYFFKVRSLKFKKDDMFGIFVIVKDYGRIDIVVGNLEKYVY